MTGKGAALQAATSYVKRSEVLPPPAKSPKPKSARARKPRKLATFCADTHFWPFVDTSAGPDACHNWQGRIDEGNGYGRLWGVEGLLYSHRAAWITSHGPIPRGKHVLHRCVGNQLCCNPDHLYLGGNPENAADRVREKRSRKRLPNNMVMDIVNARFPDFPLLVKGTKNYTAIAKEFGVANSCVAKICRGQTHSKLTGIQPGARTAVRLAMPATLPGLIEARV